MERTNAGVVFAGRGRVEIREMPWRPPGPGEVLIRTTRTLISTGTELTMLSRGSGIGSVWSEMSVFPRTAGYLNVGVVEQVGDGVSPEWLGRRVGSASIHARYVTYPVEGLRPVPDGVSDEDAAFHGLAEVAINSLRRCHLALGESVVVVGLGIIGHLTARLCALAGASHVIGIDPAPFRLERFPKGVPFHALRAAPSGLATEVRQLLKGRKADVVFEVTGNPEAIPGQLAYLRPHGRFVLLSSPRGPSSFDFHDLCNRESFVIIGAHFLSHPQVETWDTPWTPVRNSAVFLDCLASKRMSVSELISHRIPYERVSNAYQLLLNERESTLGVILDW
jgi:2-desacetyl-2-hydroxyethyl bacteriochlorophyllide A dehydrogenase